MKNMVFKGGSPNLKGFVVMASAIMQTFCLNDTNCIPNSNFIPLTVLLQNTAKTSVKNNVSSYLASAGLFLSDRTTNTLSKKMLKAG